MDKEYKIGGCMKLKPDDVAPTSRHTVIAKLNEVDAYLCEVGQRLTRNDHVEKAMGMVAWVMAIRDAVRMLREDERSEDDGK